MGRGDGDIRRRAPSGSFVELRLQMYLARNRSLHPSLPVHCHDVLSDLHYVTAPRFRFIQSAHGPFYAWLVYQRIPDAVDFAQAFSAWCFPLALLALGDLETAGLGWKMLEYKAL